MTTEWPTVPGLLARGLCLQPLADPPQPVPDDEPAYCRLSRSYISEGYRIGDVTGGSTSDPLDAFFGNPLGWASDDAARCLKAADPRLRDRDLLGDGGAVLRLDITTPAHWRHGRGRYTTMPDPRLVFGADDALQADLASRHRNPRHTLWLHWLAWGGCPLQPLTTDELTRVPLVIEQSRVLRWDSGHAGIVGTVRYDLSALGSDARATLWALARFAELRGIGKHTTYGMGRVRLRA